MSHFAEHRDCVRRLFTRSNGGFAATGEGAVPTGARCNGILRLLAEIIPIVHASTFFSEALIAPSDVLKVEATLASTLLFSWDIAFGKMS
jgi:hypothetical protein